MTITKPLEFSSPPGLVVETPEGWGKEVIRMIKTIGKLQSQHIGLPSSYLINHLFQLSCGLLNSPFAIFGGWAFLNSILLCYYDYNTKNVIIHL